MTNGSDRQDRDQPVVTDGGSGVRTNEGVIDGGDSIERIGARLTDTLAGLTARLIENGEPPDKAANQAYDGVCEVMQTQAEAFADVLADDRGYARDVTSYADGFRERIRSHWGEALDGYLIVVGAIDEASRRCMARQPTLDPLLDIVAQLNGHSLRLAREVHTLLSAGFPLGALALTRPMYETAVRALVLSEWGRARGHEDLAERYALHQRIDDARDMKTYQRDAEILGYERFDESEVTSLEAERKALLKRFGVAFKYPYGWALGLPGITNARDFSQLEALADTSHRRGFYQWSSHLIHVDSKALRLGQAQRGGVRAVMTDASNAALSDPGIHALYALNLTWTALFTSTEEPMLIDQYLGRTVSLLIDRASAAFVAGEEAVDDAERRLQAELRRDGLRMTPFGEVALRKLHDDEPGG